MNVLLASFGCQKHFRFHQLYATCFETATHMAQICLSGMSWIFFLMQFFCHSLYAYYRRSCSSFPPVWRERADSYRKYQEILLYDMITLVKVLVAYVFSIVWSKCDWWAAWKILLRNSDKYGSGLAWYFWCCLGHQKPSWWYCSHKMCNRQQKA